MSGSERTFLMIKPDAVQRGLTGEIIKRVESKGLKIVAMKMIKVTREKAEEHYAEHRDKAFFKELVSFITSSPVVVCVVEGKNAISVVRKLIGKTDPKEAEPGTIRGDLALEITYNCVHASDSQKTAEREIKLYFSEEEILNYKRAGEEWL